MYAIQIHTQGGPEVLSYEQIDEPSPGPGQVKVRVAAAGLNFIDTYQRGGLYEMATPFTPGLEGAGVVVDIGLGVTEPAVGDRVAWATNMGSYAEFAVMPADRVVAVPDGIELELAAALMLQGLTAHYLACDTYPLTATDRCLIHAGAGGVGLLLTQIAKRRGAEVFTTVGTPEKAALSSAAGADHVVLYREVDFVDAITAIVGPTPLDVVYDGVGASVFDQSLSLLHPRGTIATFGNASGAVPPVSPLALGSRYLTRPGLFDYVATSEDLQRRARDLFSWVVDGHLDVRVDARYRLADAADAHRALEGRTTTGKVILTP